MKYRMIYDLHTHTVFSHGKGTIEDNVKAAVEKGLETIGIADHGPGHLTYGVKRENFPVMRKEVERLKPLYPQIQLKLCVEANIMNPSGRLDTGKEEEREDISGFPIMIPPSLQSEAFVWIPQNLTITIISIRA